MWTAMLGGTSAFRPSPQPFLIFARSGRFHRLMSGRSLVLKSTIFPEWYADRVMPWYHFVPVKIDYTDLYDSRRLFFLFPSQFILGLK